MTRQVDGAALVWLLEQFTAVESALRDECVVVLSAKVPCAAETLRNDTNGLELGPRVAYTFFVDGECLSEELVGNLFEVALISH